MRTWNKIAVRLIGLSSLMLLGCDTAVRSTILSGLQTGTTTIVTSLITAAFQTFASSGTS